VVFTAKNAKNAKAIAKDIAFLSWYGVVFWSFRCPVDVGFRYAIAVSCGPCRVEKTTSTRGVPTQS